MISMNMPGVASFYRTDSAFAKEELRSNGESTNHCVIFVTFLGCGELRSLTCCSTQSRIPKWPSAQARGVGFVSKGPRHSSLPNAEFIPTTIAPGQAGAVRKGQSVRSKHPIEDDCREKLLF